jgi:hypothetical protein
MLCYETYSRHHKAIYCIHSSSIYPDHVVLLMPSVPFHLMEEADARAP